MRATLAQGPWLVKPMDCYRRPLQILSLGCGVAVDEKLGWGKVGGTLDIVPHLSDPAYGQLWS